MLFRSTSNTMVLAERVGGPNVYLKGGGVFASAPTPPTPATNPPTSLPVILARANGGGWGDFLNSDNWLKGCLFDGTTQAAGGPCGINCSSLRGDSYYSFHPGGIQVQLADASVRFLSETTAAFVVASLTTRQKGETFTMP